MTEQFNGPLDDEKAEAQATRPICIQPLECFEGSWNLIGRDANPGVVDVNTHVGSTAATGQQDASRISIFDRIAHQISHNAIQHNSVAHDDCAGWADTQLEPSVLRELDMLGSDALE